MALHTKAARRRARRCYAERCAYPLRRLDAPACEPSPFAREMEALSGRMRVAHEEMHEAALGLRHSFASAAEQFRRSLDVLRGIHHDAPPATDPTAPAPGTLYVVRQGAC